MRSEESFGFEIVDSVLRELRSLADDGDCNEESVTSAASIEEKLMVTSRILRVLGLLLKCRSKKTRTIPYTRARDDVVR